MPEHLTIFIVEHSRTGSREGAFDEAMRADRALEALGLKVIGGSYAAEGSAASRAMRLLLSDPEDAP